MLTEPVDDGTVMLDFAALGGARPELGPRTGADRAAWRVTIVRVSIAAGIFLAAGAFAVIFIAASGADSGEASRWPSWIYVVGGGALVLVCVLLGSYILVVTARLDIVRLGGPLRRARLTRFAAANPGVRFLPEVSDARYPGFAFEKSRHPVAFDVVRLAGTSIEVGNLLTRGSAGNRQLALVFGYLKVRLPSRLPHILAISTKDRGHSAVPAVVIDDQKLSLEGDFNEHFTLYVPSGYERDALYVFGPDLMVRLIDFAGRCDVEIVDDQLLVYSHRPFDMLDPATYRRSLGIAAAVGSKVTKQAYRYRDDRAVEPGEIRSQGRRLRSLPSMLGVFVAVMVGLGVFIALISR